MVHELGTPPLDLDRHGVIDLRPAVACAGQDGDQSAGVVERGRSAHRGHRVRVLLADAAAQRATLR
jgi:hypothetical protein